jgi:hypothetical protein
MNKILTTTILLLLSLNANASLNCEAFKTDRTWSDDSSVSISVFELSKDVPKKQLILDGNMDDVFKIVVLNAELSERSLSPEKQEEFGIFGVNDHWQFIYSKSAKNEREVFYRVENKFFKVKCD